MVSISCPGLRYRTTRSRTRKHVLSALLMLAKSLQSSFSFNSKQLTEIYDVSSFFLNKCVYRKNIKGAKI